MKRRTLIQAALGLGLAAASPSLAACGSAESDTSDGSGGKKITLGFSAWPGWLP